MKKIVLSSLVALTLGTISATAGDIKFYTDANGQVFVTPAEGRTELKVNPAKVMQAMQTATQISTKNMKEEIKAEIKEEIKKDTPVFAKADKLKFSGQTFLGYKHTSYDNASADSDQSFELRRGYFQVKAYLLDDPKSYYRVTLDLTKDSSNDMKVRAKYAYLNLNEVLPVTSLEIGLAHRPWHDYEEHNSWLYRSISEILVENHNSAHLASSADFGVMAKTRTKFFDSDIGVFNGEGYHGAQNSNGMSLEWRFTGHLLGTHGHPEKNTYLDASCFGQLNKEHYNNTITGEQEDLDFYGFHTVYNQPEFLVSAQYITSSDTADTPNTISHYAGKGYSFNGEYRLGADKEYKILARYDRWEPDVASGVAEEIKKVYIGGVAWKQNKNVEWVANITKNDNTNVNVSGASKETTDLMITTEINW